MGASAGRVDLNSDLGEGFGVYRLGADDDLLAIVTSANVACGFHAGDPETMRRTVRAALAKGVAVGAHPGLPDLAGFGRRAMAVSPEEAEDLVIYQIGALEGFAKASGGRLRHVKPHGALYNMAARDRPQADAIARAVRSVDPELILYGLSDSELIRAGKRAGLRTASEAFADRQYDDDGTLVPRSQPGAVIADAAAAAERAVRMVARGTVPSAGGKEIEVRADTICIHSDSPGAPAMARTIRRRLEAEGIAVRAVEP